MNPSILARRPPRGTVSLVGPGRHHHQQRLGEPDPASTQPQPPPAAPRLRMPAVAPCAPTSAPTHPVHTVVVDDMVVAEDTDSDTEIVDDSDEEDSDGEAKPKVIKVITRKPAAVPIGSPEPSWHALLRRTPNSRTASIACSVPRAATRPAAEADLRPGGAGLPQQVQLGPLAASASSRIINVPARVLVPRNRLVFPVATRGRTFTIGRQLGRQISRQAPNKAAVAVQGRQSGRAPGVSVLGPRVYVSATGPLSAPERAVLDGVLDMQEEQGVLPGDEAGDAKTIDAKASVVGDADTAADTGAIITLMMKYGVRSTDTFHGDCLI